MNPAINNLRLWAILPLVVTMLTAPGVVFGQQPATTNQVIPLVVMDEVPLGDAIANLARMAGINCILDPRLSDMGITVTGRWTNSTAEQVLGSAVRQQGLAMVTNPATSVVRIVSTNQTLKPPPANSAPATNGVPRPAKPGSNP